VVGRNGRTVEGSRNKWIELRYYAEYAQEIGYKVVTTELEIINVMIVHH